MKPSRLLFLLLPTILLADSTYYQNNLVSDIPGLAAVTDPHLVNPWGVSFSSSSPFWVSNAGSNTSTLYTGSGSVIPLVVSVALPTGQVFNGTSSFVAPGSTSPSAFIFSTIGGTINAWNPSTGTNAPVAATTPGAAYTGLAKDSSGGSNYLYAANFEADKVDVFNSSFGATALAGSFKDPTLPAGYTTYNVQNIGGQLYVTYAKVDPTTHREDTQLGFGYVSVFNPDGTFVKRLISNGQLDAPWGITLAPSSFGAFGGDLLVGNFGNGEINAFNPTSGAFQGVVADISASPIVNTGLWSLEFGNGGAGGDKDKLYFTAGIDGQSHGLLGSIQPTPEPSAWALGTLGLAGLLGFARRRRLD